MIKKIYVLTLTFIISTGICCGVAFAGTCTITAPGFVGANNEKSQVNSVFGRRFHPIDKVWKTHTGVDVNVPGSADCGAALPVQQGCTQKFYGTRGGYGNHLILDCGNGVEISYSHLQDWNPNTQTAYVGTTGHSTGCHLHFETKIDNKLVDPACVFGTGTDCPQGLSAPPNLCNAEEREALKNNGSSMDGKPNPSGGDGGTKGTASPSDPDNPDGDHDDNHDHDDFSDPKPADPSPPFTGGDDDPLDIPQPNPEEEEKEKPRPSEEYKGQATKPICDNSTCILQDMIDTAKNQHVQYDKAKDYYEYITHEGECKDPIKTNVTVFRQAKGETKKYPDAFCSNQGCAYKNDGGGGDGKCE